MANERIHNERTGHYYRIRQRDSKNGRKGQIMDRWHRDE